MIVIFSGKGNPTPKAITGRPRRVWLLSLAGLLAGASALALPGQVKADPTPVVSSVSPAFGPLTDGQTVTVYGSGFTGATAVNFGSTPADSFHIASDTQITATAPAASADNTVDITVTTPAGTSPAVSGQLSWSGVTASASSNYPGYSPTEAIDGTLSTMWSSAQTGSDGQWISFDFGAAVTTNRWVVISRNSGGGDANGTPHTYEIQSSADNSTWTTKATSAASTAWPAGPAAEYGATLVGQTNFASTSARYWRVLAQGAYQNANYAEYYEIYAYAPSPSDLYSYIAPAPVITSISPESGSVAGGTSLSINGSGFTAASSVTFAGQAASFTVTSDTHITATSPSPGGPETAEVDVSTPGGTSTGTSGTQVSLSGVNASASSSYSDAFPPSQAIDGDLNTAWSSANAGSAGQWLSLDFGSPTALSQFVVYDSQANGAPASYQVQTSSDNSTWTTVGSSAPATTWPSGPIAWDGLTTLIGTADFKTATSQYWRILCVGSFNGSFSDEFDEIQAFSTISTNLFDYTDNPWTGSEAQAGNGNETATITGGLLSITNMGDGEVSAQLPASQATGALPSADYADATGSGSGWKVTVQATAFHGAVGPDITSGFFLDSADSAPITPVGTTDTSLPGGALPAFVSDTSSDILGSSPVEFLSAAANTGMGTYYGAESVVLDLTPSVYAEVYTSTVTFTIMTGP